MTGIASIVKSLSSFFAEQDKKIEDRDVEWAMERVAAIAEYKKANDHGRRGNISTYYEGLFAAAGGKTWYNIFYGRNRTMIEEAVRKSAQNTAKKRNHKIADKLQKKGVEEVLEASVVYCTDGFRGVFKINGDKFVTIESILAGGYNIQRLHQRVLVNVK